MSKAATRQEVYEVIDGERDYQDAMAGNAARETLETNRELPSAILLMEGYMDKLRAAWAKPSPEGRLEALHIVRKVTALGVMAMEYHGAPAR